VRGAEDNVLLNAWVVSQWFREVGLRGAAPPSEASLFGRFCARSGLAAGCDVYREVALNSTCAVLAMHYCAAHDGRLNGSRMPTSNWMRDDRLGARR
jgi:hypothetical protein